MPPICSPTSVGKAGGRMGCWVGYGAGGQADLNKRRIQDQRPVALTCSTIPKSRFPSPVSTASPARLSSDSYSFGKLCSARPLSHPPPPGPPPPPPALRVGVPLGFFTDVPAQPARELPRPPPPRS